MTTASEGLAGIIAGRSAIATVGNESAGLTYRGYSITDLARHALVRRGRLFAHLQPSAQ